MDISFKANSVTDKDNLVLAFVNGGYKVSTKWIERNMFDVAQSHWLVTVHNYTQKLENLESTLNEVYAELEKLQQEFQCYRETAEETARCYNDSHQDSWIFEQALREIRDKDDWTAPIIAEKALNGVWQRRQDRANERMNKSLNTDEKNN